MGIKMVTKFKKSLYVICKPDLGSMLHISLCYFLITIRTKETETLGSKPLSAFGILWSTPGALNSIPSPREGCVWVGVGQGGPLNLVKKQTRTPKLKN